MRGRKISTDLKYTILALGGLHSVPEIAALTAVSRRQIHRIRKNWETTGCVEPDRARKRTGRPRFLTPDEEAVSSFFLYHRAAFDETWIQYVIACVERTPDIYLEDVQSQLVVDLGLMVSRKLIWKTLQRNGLTMKKVNDHQLSPIIKGE